MHATKTENRTTTTPAKESAKMEQSVTEESQDVIPTEMLKTTTVTTMSGKPFSQGATISAEIC